MTQTPAESEQAPPSMIGENPTAKAAAELLGVDPARVRQWARDGRLEPVEGSEPLRVTLDSVLRLRESRQESGGDQVQPKASRRTLSELQATAARVESLESELRQQREELLRLKDEHTREVRQLERSAGRAEVLETVIEDLKLERDKLAAQLEQARARKRWRRRNT